MKNLLLGIFLTTTSVSAATVIDCNNGDLTIEFQQPYTGLISFKGQPAFPVAFTIIHTMTQNRAQLPVTRFTAVTSEFEIHLSKIVDTTGFYKTQSENIPLTCEIYE
jgi:hypothetical protein